MNVIELISQIPNLQTEVALLKQKEETLEELAKDTRNELKEIKKETKEEFKELKTKLDSIEKLIIGQDAVKKEKDKWIDLTLKVGGGALGVKVLEYLIHLIK